MITIFFGNSGPVSPLSSGELKPHEPVVQPQYGFHGNRNIAALVRQALENKDLTALEIV